VVSISTAKSPTLRTSLIGLVTPFMSEPSPDARLNVKMTSSAVKGVPSWNFTPWRSSKRHTVGLDWLHLVASAGTTPMVLSRSTSGS
jgi:hypothetical protein